MPPVPQSIVERLVDSDSAVFESALVEFRTEMVSDSGAACEQIVTCFRALADAMVLDSTERRRRAALILQRYALTEAFCRDLAKEAAQFPAEIRNAIASAVPAKFKGLAYGRAENVEPARNVIANQSHPEATPPPVSVAEVDRGLVLLLGSARDHEHNNRRLKADGFPFQRAGSIEDFRRMLSDDVCSIVVAKSWWNLIPAVEHSHVLDELLAFSSFVWLKINTDGLSVQNVFERFKEIRFCDPRATQLQAANSHDITDAESELLHIAAGFSRDAAQGRLYPGEIPTRDARLIVGSTKAYVQDRNSTDRGTLREVSARILQGGRSGMMLLQLSSDQRALPFVAKIGDVKALREELRRFHTFVAPFDRQLKPELHFHQDRAAIVFGLVADPSDDCRAAPTLADILDDSLFFESGGSDACATASELNTLIGRVIETLKRLNGQEPGKNNIASCMWTGLDVLSKMDDAGILWRLLPLSSGECPLEVCRDADKCLLALNDASVVHGDIHLRNILVRDHREPHLIDYAYTGPGHPCFDLVRLESALLFHAFRMTDSEEVIRELLIAINKGAAFDDLQVEFPTLTHGIGNSVAINASIGVRQACLELLQDYGATEGQYHAMKLIVSCQSLALPQCQTGVVRASISAAAELFLRCKEKAKAGEPTAANRPAGNANY